MYSNIKCRWIDGNFDCRGNAAVRRGGWSHWMPRSVKCSHSIAPAAAMVNKFVEKTQNANKTQLEASNYGTFWALVVSENFIPKTNPLISSSMRQASCKCKTPWLELKSLRLFLAIKCWNRKKTKKVIKRSRSSIYKLAHMCATRRKAVNPKTDPLLSSASPNRARPGLHWKPLDASIGKLPASYRPGGHHGHQICWNITEHWQNTTFS
jgi:hypothetical protein